MFMFGSLKFFDPFKKWYSVQIELSGLGETSYALGIIGELVVGMAFLSAIRFQQKVGLNNYKYISIISSVAVIIMMSVAVYVHVQPAVPGDVLPLKIKAPFIPIAFLLAASVNTFALSKLQKPTTI